MFRITINSYLRNISSKEPFLSNLPQLKIFRIIYSDLIKKWLRTLGRRTIVKKLVFNRVDSRVKFKRV